MPRRDDRRPIAAAIDGRHTSSSTLAHAFIEASLCDAPVLVVHSAPLAELTSDEQEARLNLAEILAGWRTDYPDVNVDTLLLSGPPRDTVATVSADAQLLVVGVPLPRPGMDALDPFCRPGRTRTVRVSGRRHSAAAPGIGDSRLGPRIKVR
jgi:nucleotide-binding universal stress UspA family protein